MRIITRAALLTAAAVGFLGVEGFQAVQAAEAQSCVRVYRIYYNSPGSDRGGSSSLNAEWISLHNSCSSRRLLKAWTIRDAAGHIYTFGSSYRLGGGAYVRVHTGKGRDTATDRYWGMSWYVWNNDRDTAYLGNLHGKVVDTCSYDNPSASSTYC